MKRLLALVIAALALCRAAAVFPAPLATSPTAPTTRRVLLISVDGLRPDLLLRAQAPVLRGLMQRGSFTMWAQTTASAVTLPSHTSMLTGVSPSSHGIEWNTDLPPGKHVYSARPTLFDLASQAGFTTAMVAGKSKFTPLARPGTLRWWYIPKESAVSDAAVTDTAVGFIERHQPQVLFVHLPSVDGAGHAQDWGSERQLAAIAEADRCIGRLLDALQRRRLLDSTLVMVSADHGGAGKSHGPDDPRSRFIPWIAAGPGVRRNVDLTTYADLNVRTEDTFATICAQLGIAVPKPIDGRPVDQILERPRAK